VLDDAFARFEAEIEAIKSGVALFQKIDDTQALQVVLEAAMRAHAGVQRVLAGMAEGRVSEVVGQRNGFDQVFVEMQGARHAAGDLRDFDAVRQAGAEEVALVVDENLRLVFEPAKGG
jgi:hypothetical protein